MIYKKLLSMVLLVLLLAPMNFAYLPDDDKTEDEKIAELKANARNLIRETSAMILTLNSPTNRINFTIKSGDILWELDEIDARAMFNRSTDDVKRLMVQVDLEVNQQANAGNLNSTRRSSTNNLSTKTSQVISLRSALVTALANHDPEWAMRFLQETSQIFTNQGLIKRIEQDDKRLESQIVKKIASKDVTKALELGREKLSKGVTSEVISLLSQIYVKDREKGAGFAKDILQKLNSMTLGNNNSWMVISLFQIGLNSVTSNKTPPLFDDSAMNSLAELVSRQVTSSSSRYRTLSPQMMSGLEKYAPNSAAQVKRTFDQRNSERTSRNGSANPPPPPPPPPPYPSRQEIWEERSKLQKELSENLNKLNDKTLSSEDKQKIIKESRDKILSVEDDNYRFSSLVGLAVRIVNIGEKEAAISILNEAEFFIKQNPKEKNDFSNNRTLANVFALVEYNKSFVILENMAYQLNGVIDGYIKFMEFSGNRNIVENNELIMNSQTLQFTNYFMLSPLSIKALAEGDYGRLNDLADKFERPEIRVETKLLIAKGLLSVGSQKKPITFFSGFTRITEEF